MCTRSNKRVQNLEKWIDCYGGAIYYKFITKLMHIIKIKICFPIRGMRDGNSKLIQWSILKTYTLDRYFIRLVEIIIYINYKFCVLHIFK